MKIIVRKNEGFMIERKETKNSENTPRNAQLMSHEVLTYEHRLILNKRCIL